MVINKVLRKLSFTLSLGIILSLSYIHAAEKKSPSTLLPQPKGEVELLRCIDQIRAEKWTINPILAPNGVIFIGRDGAGKSTLLQWLCGGELKAVQGKSRVEAYTLVAAKETASKAKHSVKGKEERKEKDPIDYKAITKASYPPPRLYEEVAYWTFPGLGSSTAIHQALFDISAIKRTFDPTKAYKVLLLVPENDFSTSRGISFRRMLNILDNFFPNLEKIADQLSLLITKATATDQQSARALLANIKDGSDLPRAQECLLRYLIRPESRIAFFKRPTTAGAIDSSEREQIRKMLTAAPNIKCITIKSSGISADAKQRLRKALYYAKCFVKREIAKELNQDLVTLADQIVAQGGQAKEIRDKLTELHKCAYQLVGKSAQDLLTNYQKLRNSYPNLLPDRSADLELWLNRIAFIKAEYLS